MDVSRQANREANEITTQYQSPQDILPVDELNENKLRQSMVFMSWLEQTLLGAAELQRRIKLFGDCQRIGGETSGHFNARQCHWLEQALPKKNIASPTPRQLSDSKFPSLRSGSLRTARNGATAPHASPTEND